MAERLPMPETSIWNDYWHFDRLSSFETEGAVNYGEEFAAGWNAFFDRLPSGASILDLCTGNGAIAVIAAQAGRRSGKRFRIVGVDTADINPCLYVTKHRDELAAIEFRSATPVENLPWPPASFDAVVSQFGIEYSHLRESIGELARMVAPNGSARLVLHAAEGRVVETSRRVIEEIDFLLGEVDLAGKAQHCLRAMAAVERRMDRSEKALSDARESSHLFQQALLATGRRLAASADPAMLRNSGRMLEDVYRRRGQYDLAGAIGVVEGIRTEWRNHRERLAAQVDAAVTCKRRAELAAMLKGLGARDVEEFDLRAPGGVIGHCVEAQF